MTHTPGPWKKVSKGNGIFTIEQVDGAGLIGTAGNNNADLIIAAPDMLAALKELTEDMRAIKLYSGGRDIGKVSFAKAWNKSLVAIAKAEGRGEATTS